MTVRYVQGHNPDLVMASGARIDLTKHATRDAVEALLAARGFRKHPPPTCENRHAKADECHGWAISGECASNPTFMHASCAASCNACPGDAREL